MTTFITVLFSHLATSTWGRLQAGNMAAPRPRTRQRAYLLGFYFPGGPADHMNIRILHFGLYGRFRELGSVA